MRITRLSRRVLSRHKRLVPYDVEITGYDCMYSVEKFEEKWSTIIHLFFDLISIVVFVLL